MTSSTLHPPSTSETQVNGMASLILRVSCPLSSTTGFHPASGFAWTAVAP